MVRHRFHLRWVDPTMAPWRQGSMSYPSTSPRIRVLVVQQQRVSRYKRGRPTALLRCGKGSASSCSDPACQSDSLSNAAEISHCCKNNRSGRKPLLVPSTATKLSMCFTIETDRQTFSERCGSTPFCGRSRRRTLPQRARLADLWVLTWPSNELAYYLMVGCMRTKANATTRSSQRR